MKAESSPVSIDLKTAAYKALLQGPLVFIQFSSRFGVTRKDMQIWLDEAGANLCLVEEDAQPGACSSRMRGGAILVREELKVLLGRDF